MYVKTRYENTDVIPPLATGACSGKTELTAPEGEISVRGDAYRNDMSCRWIIKAPRDSVSVLLTFNWMLYKFFKKIKKRKGLPVYVIVSCPYIE